MAPRKPDVPDTLTDNDPAHMTDAELAAATSAAAHDAELAAATSAAAHDAGTLVTLAVGHPYDELVLHDIEDDKGKPLIITSTGTDVPAAQVDDIKAAAKAADVQIRKVN